MTTDVIDQPQTYVPQQFISKAVDDAAREASDNRIVLVDPENDDTRKKIQSIVSRLANAKTLQTSDIQDILLEELVKEGSRITKQQIDSVADEIVARSDEFDDRIEQVLCGVDSFDLTH